jgi:flagellar basal body-associated protein FliL
MNWSMGSDSAQIWIVLLCTLVALAIATGIFFLVTWKKRGIDEQPLPHCNLQERLTQLAQNTMLEANKSA